MRLCGIMHFRLEEEEEEKERESFEVIYMIRLCSFGIHSQIGLDRFAFVKSNKYLVHIKPCCSLSQS